MFAGIREETKRNMRFKVSNSGTDDKWRKYSRWDWGVVRSIRNEGEKIWRANDDHERCYQPVEGEEDNQESDQPWEENVKLSKLATSPFTGTHIDFFQFWNQFRAQIDKSELSLWQN